MPQAGLKFLGVELPSEPDGGEFGGATTVHPASTTDFRRRPGERILTAAVGLHDRF